MSEDAYADTGLMPTGDPPIGAGDTYIVPTTQDNMYKLNMDLAISIADELMKVVAFKEKQGQPIVKNIGGKLYPMAPCWQIVGAQLQVYPQVEWTTPEHADEIAAAFSVGTLTAKARQVLKTYNGVIVGAGEAICSQAETQVDRNTGDLKPRWNDAYAIVSMAQTRALGKAFRNSFGWVVQLAGMEATPAEEMDGVSPNSFGNVPVASEDPPDVAVMYPVLTRGRVNTLMMQATTNVSEDEMRSFVWTVGLIMAEDNVSKAMDIVNKWGSFPDQKQKGRMVPGPMPWRKKKDGTMMMKDKWLGKIVTKAKEALAESGL